MAYTTINDPSAHFQVETYTGGGANSTVTFSGNSDLQPDLLWIKRRNASYGHNLFDTNRGIAKLLEPDNNNSENTNQTWISGVSSDSFTIGVNEHNLSNTSGTYVAWAWKMNGGTTSTNSDGDINTTVQVNSDAGMSIVTYSPPNATARNIGHGLGAVPKFIIIRARNRSENWHVFHYSEGTGGLMLDSTAVHNNNSVLGDTLPTSSVYKLGTDYRMNGAFNYVGYFFADVQGFSKFGSYVGNANADGPFIHTGFKPAWIMIKGADYVDDWYIFDHKRLGHNPEVFRLRANTTAAETTGTNNTVDLLSNGFKLRFSGGSINGSGSTYIYAAFAENPFVTSTGAPTTAI